MQKRRISRLLLVATTALSMVSHAYAEGPQVRTANNGNLVMQDVPEIPKEIVNDLRRYQNVRSAPFREFTQDGSSIFVSTRFGNVSQIHKVDNAGGARQQITFFQEPIGSVNRRPNTNNLGFSMDEGGSEFAQLYLLDTQTGDYSMLTDGQSKNDNMVWNQDGSLFAFRSTKRNGTSNDLWYMSPEDKGSAKLLLEANSGSYWGPIAWSEDSKQLLVQEYISAANSYVYLLDVESKERTLIAGDLEKDSVNFGLAYDRHEKGFFFITNQFSEFNQLAYKDFKSGEVTVITKNIDWNVAGFAIDKTGKRAAFTINEEGFNTLYLMDTKYLTYKKVEDLPIGLIGGLSFSDTGRNLGLTLNTAQSPSDSYVLKLDRKPLHSDKLTRWTFSEVGGLDTSKFAEPQLIRYESFDKRSIPAFIYKPQLTTKKQKLPVIISIHGGPESQYRPSFSSTFQLWVKQLGAAVIAPNVRGSAGYGKEYLSLDNGFKREDSVKDIGALLDWIKTQPDLDSERVAVIGGSYGGYMVLASAVHYSDRLKAAVDIVGISNFVTFLENTKSYRRDLRRVEYGDERDPDMRKHLQAISPNNHVDKIDIPMFVVQGHNDPRVPVTEAEQIVKALQEKGKPVWYMDALNEGHGYRKKENRDIYTQAVVLFFKEYL
ncbi:S9 family peptidase [Alteromonas sp. a30]|uniref:S9 family peptidase n=1 Tax=Alteromonas sp. a30 TaxID=2730917 RepID=UPI0022809C86|nr:S9 family peptidase [Alteromonas sp. a30]MCY7297131.1 alpha/beta fold hydrolase [Alteromonas sp. a30]